MLIAQFLRLSLRNVHDESPPVLVCLPAAQDVGPWLKRKIKDHFKGTSITPDVKCDRGQEELPG